MKIVVRGEPPCDLVLVRRAMRLAAKRYGLPADAQATLVFVDDAAMRELNRRYRRKDRTTDVLSFGQRLPRRAKGETAVAALARDVDGTLDLGDVVVGGAQAARQAKRRGWPLASEVAFLAAHGVLHLLGFDDATMAGYREMKRLGSEALDDASGARRQRHPRGRPPKR